MSVTTARPGNRGLQHDGDIRELLQDRLPGCLQTPLTYLTGKPYRGQPGGRLTPGYHLAGTASSTIAGVAISALGVRTATWLLTPALVLLGWAITLHAIRNLRMMIFHQCAHRNMFGRKRFDAVLGRLLAGLLIVQDFSAYRREHTVDHHAASHMTLRDPTVQAILIGLGLRPGMSRRRMWRILLARSCSPVFHFRFFVGRLHSYWHGAPARVRWVTVVVYLGVAAMLTMVNGWILFLVCWAAPLTVLFQISNVFRLAVRHTFPGPDGNRRGREHFAGLTNAIFLASSPPPRGVPRHRAVAGWLRWAAVTTFVHFPVRYLVLTGDTVCHDYHHRFPMSRDWANYIFARQRDVERGHPGWPPYREHWGAVAAVNAVLDSLSVADPEEFDAHRIPQVSNRSLFASFED